MRNQVSERAEVAPVDLADAEAAVAVAAEAEGLVVAVVAAAVVVAEPVVATLRTCSAGAMPCATS